VSTSFTVRAPGPIPSSPGSVIVAVALDGEFEEGRQVVAMMGGMGRTLDGGYAAYKCVPAM
jgi:hypothetical protein